MRAGLSWIQDEKGKIGHTSLLAVNKKNRRIIFQSTSIQGTPVEKIDGIVDTFRFNDNAE